MMVLKTTSLFILLLITQLSYAGSYESFMGNSIIVKQYDRYFDGYVAGIAYNFIRGDYRNKTTDVFNSATPPPLHQEQAAHLDAVDAFIGYGQQLNRLLYVGLRGGVQLYTESNVDFYRSSPGELPDATLKDKYRARQSGYVDLIPGLVIEDRFMLYPLVGFSNTKYVYQGSILEAGKPALE